MSEFLDLPLRSLRDVHDEIAAGINALDAKRERLVEAASLAGLELRFEEEDALLAQIDAIGDELGPLLDRLENLEDEIAWREQPRFGGGAP